MRQKGRVGEVNIWRAAGTKREFAQALKRSAVSTHADTAFIERFDAIQVRHHNNNGPI